MLVLTATQPVTRVQGAFVSEEEIAGVVGFLKQQGRPVYDESILKARDSGSDARRDDDDEDPVYDEALALVSRMEEVSVSKLQREMRLGYNKAAKIVERMEREGVVGPANGVKPRQVLIRPAGEMIVLIKPQFEAGRGQVGKGGIVRDPEVHRAACDRVSEAVRQFEFATAIMESPILGAEGNKEFLLHARH